MAVKTSVPTLGEWLGEWLRLYKIPQVSPGTAERDEHSIKLILTCPQVEIPLTEFDERSAQLLLNGLQQREYRPGVPYSKSTLKKVKGVLYQAMQAAKMEHLVEGNPVKDAVIPKAKTQVITPFTREERQRIEAACGEDPLGHLLLFLMDTGLRQSELCGLTWNDFSPEENLIRVEKSKTEAGVRPVFLIRRAREIIDRQPAGKAGDPIFRTMVGTPISKSTMVNLCARISAKTGIKVRCHRFRHTFANRLCEKNESAKTIAQIIGHAGTGYVLDLYAKMEKEDLRKGIYRLDEAPAKEETLELSLPPEAWAVLCAEADRQSVPPETLVRIWLCEKLDELRGRGERPLWAK